jgi:glutathione S-transferase
VPLAREVTAGHHKQRSADDGSLDMRLIGMMDSPYVRRVALSLKFMGIAFTHEPVSVFRHYDAFAAINPVVKAPSLVIDDGTVLMESTLILEYLEQLVPPQRRLTPTALADLARSQRVIGLALAACEKSVQIIYEHNLRPAEKRHQPWIDRVRGQLLVAYGLLEAECASAKGWFFGARPLQADITAAVAWAFTQHTLADTVGTADYPALCAFSKRAEALPEMLSAPMG